MPGPARSGAIIYAKNLDELSLFYQRVLGMTLLLADSEHHVIESEDIQLVIHAIPEHLASTITISSPPVPREQQAIKLFFTVRSLEDAAQEARARGGRVFGPEYAGPGFRVRNAYDLEGNIFHVRENAA
jgi:predicted enzyme related to lactoylglutathione lyase